MAAMAGLEKHLREDMLVADQRHNSRSLAAVTEWQGQVGDFSMVCGTTSNSSNEERYGSW